MIALYLLIYSNPFANMAYLLDIHGDYFQVPADFIVNDQAEGVSSMTCDPTLKDAKVWL